MLSAAILPAQTAAEMDLLLETREVSFAQASRFVLASADAAAEGVEVRAAFDLARENGWLSKKAVSDNPIRLGELCFLVMKAFHMRGSFLYALFPGPRYAFRELEYRRLIPGRRDPSLRVSGEELLRMLDLVTAGVNVEWVGMSASVPVQEEAEIAAVPEEIPVLPESVAEEREQIAVVIRAELEEHEVTDTSVRVVEEGVVISLNNIQFLPDSVELTQQEMTKLWEIAAILSRFPERPILVGGHTAQAGNEEGRLRISTERARAVADFLVTLQVRRAEDITVQGYGAERPLGDAATEEGRALNRRVEIILLDEVRP
jgi:outer membrane protein OmpA-like peptidoglycan-associated protein